MTRNRPRDRIADQLAARLDHAATILPTIRAHLREQRQHVAVLSATVTDTSPGGGGHSDPTLRVVMALERISYREGVIDDALASINVGINLLDAECRNALGHRAPSTLETCHGGNPSTWGSDTCGRHVGYRLGDDASVHLDPDGLCDEHRIAKTAHDARADSSNQRRQRRRT